MKYTLVAPALLASTVTASVVDLLKRSTLDCTNYQAAISQVQSDEDNAEGFCTSWLKSDQTESSISGLDATVLTDACRCIMAPASNAAKRKQVKAAGAAKIVTIKTTTLTKTATTTTTKTTMTTNTVSTTIKFSTTLTSVFSTTSTAYTTLTLSTCPAGSGSLSTSIIAPHSVPGATTTTPSHTSPVPACPSATQAYQFDGWVWTLSTLLTGTTAKPTGNDAHATVKLAGLSRYADAFIDCAQHADEYYEVPMNFNVFYENVAAEWMCVMWDRSALGTTDVADGTVGCSYIYAESG
ncbi:hypothetical protein ANO11243_041780 [Dothideomycetidae sp. 11243]|nr:hypothetical protein ANO11243_041780 [fungal sp. No.11243]